MNNETQMFLVTRDYRGVDPAAYGLVRSAALAHLHPCLTNRYLHPIYTHINDASDPSNTYPAGHCRAGS